MQEQDKTNVIAEKRRKIGAIARKHKRASIIALIIIVVVLAGAVYVLFFGLPWEITGGGGPADENGPVDTGEGGEPDGPEGQGGSEIIPWEPTGDLKELWYYDLSRVKRYESFAARMPELPPEDVIWMVDADLDVPPYSETREVADPMSITLLVNKHFYFSNEFTPSDLVSFGDTMLRDEAAKAMEKMIDEAAGEGHILWAQSGFRSYEVQTSLYEQYSERDGVEEADAYSARPGYSEHQSGLTADLNTITDAFGETAEGHWAAENCWRFGFVLRYTKENTDITQYKPEPWHLRYIGEEAAEEMHELGFLSFEEYWVKYIKYTPPPVG
ncbi:MAG: M15 family metallopeptidase [Clostridiales bacterium]|nr:M15 family metallopeptidase [Clostridiales bacterium]